MRQFVDGLSLKVGWRDLREWLSLIEAKGLIKRIDQSVDPDERLSAIAFMATRREDAPALLFDHLVGDRFGAGIQCDFAGLSRVSRKLRGTPQCEILRAE